MKKTQYERVLDYMKEFGSITTLEAFRDLGVTRLSAVIYNIRRTHTVKDCFVSARNRYGDVVSFKKYWIEND